MKIEHAALYVNDLEAAKDFFVRYLDAVPNEATTTRGRTSAPTSLPSGRAHASS